MTTLHIVTDTKPRDPFPLDRPTEQVIAERMLASALHNYHKAFTKQATVGEFTTWYDLTETQKAFYLDFAIPAAIQCVWKGR